MAVFPPMAEMLDVRDVTAASASLHFTSGLPQPDDAFLTRHSQADNTHSPSQPGSDWDLESGVEHVDPTPPQLRY